MVPKERMVKVLMTLLSVAVNIAGASLILVGAVKLGSLKGVKEKARRDEKTSARRTIVSGYIVLILGLIMLIVFSLIQSSQGRSLLDRLPSPSPPVSSLEPGFFIYLFFDNI